MKIKFLIFSLFLTTVIEHGVTAQVAKPIVYTPDEMEVLNEMHGEYARVSNEILGEKKSDNYKNSERVISPDSLGVLGHAGKGVALLDDICKKFTNKSKIFAPDSNIKRLIPFLAACCALYLKGGVGQILNNSTLDSVGQAYDKFNNYSDASYRSSPAVYAYEDNRRQARDVKYDLDRYTAQVIIYPGDKYLPNHVHECSERLTKLNGALPELERTKAEALAPCNEAWGDLTNFLYSGWDKSGIGYALAAYIGTNLLLNIITGLMSEETTTSLSSLKDLEDSVRRILSDEHTLDKDFRDDAYDQLGAGFILLDKQVRPEFRESTIKALERDYLLFYDKISRERETGSKVGINFIHGAIKLAITAFALTCDKNYTKNSFLFGLAAFFVLNNFILPSKDEDEKSDILANIYQIIKAAKTRHFEYVKQNAQVQEMEIKNNVVTPEQAKAVAGEVKLSRFRRLLNLFSRKKNNIAEKKSESEEVKAEVDSVEKEMKLNIDIQQKQRNLKRLLIKVGVGYVLIACAIGGVGAWMDYQRSCEYRY